MRALSLNTALVSGPGVNIPEAVFVVFQMTFAIITTILIVGAVADRMKFGSLMLFAALAAVMYVTRHLDWGGRKEEEAVSEGGPPPQFTA
jgi:Amt family ammonium transporter